MEDGRRPLFRQSGLEKDTLIGQCVELLKRGLAAIKDVEDLKDIHEWIESWFPDFQADALRVEIRELMTFRNFSGRKGPLTDLEAALAMPQPLVNDRYCQSQIEMHIRTVSDVQQLKTIRDALVGLLGRIPEPVEVEKPKLEGEPVPRGVTREPTRLDEAAAIKLETADILERGLRRSADLAFIRNCRAALTAEFPPAPVPVKIWGDKGVRQRGIGQTIKGGPGSVLYASEAQRRSAALGMKS